MKRFNVTDGNIASYKLTEKFTLDNLDVNKVLENPELRRQACIFALGHVLRNSTAGLMKDEHKPTDFAEAIDAIKARAKSIFEDGKWAAVRQAGESAAGTILAQALARVAGVEVKAAAEQIDQAVEEAMNEKGMDPEASQEELTAEQKTERRKLIAAVHKEFAKDAQIKLAMSEISLAAQQARVAAAKKDAEGKESAFAPKK